MKLGTFVSELRRRRVVRVAAAYAVVAWLAIQVGEATFPAFGIPEWALRLVVVLAVLGSAGWIVLPPFLNDYDTASLLQSQRTLRFVPNAQGGYDVHAAPATLNGLTGIAVEPHPGRALRRERSGVRRDPGAIGSPRRPTW